VPTNTGALVLRTDEDVLEIEDGGISDRPRARPMSSPCSSRAVTTVLEFAIAFASVSGALCDEATPRPLKRQPSHQIHDRKPTYEQDPPAPN
jgi:hypothetical protein